MGGIFSSAEKDTTAATKTDREEKAKNTPKWINDLGAAIYALIREHDAWARLEKALDSYVKTRWAEIEESMVFTFV